MLTLPGAMAGSTGVITAVGCALVLGGLAGYTYALWGRACHATGGKTPVECCRTLRLPLCVQLSAPSAGDALRMVSVMLYAVKVNGAIHSWKWLRFFWAVPSTLVEMPSARGKENRLVSCYSNSSPLWLRLKQSLAMVVALLWCPQSETGRRRFRRARFQTPNS